MDMSVVNHLFWWYIHDVHVSIVEIEAARYSSSSSSSSSSDSSSSSYFEWWCGYTSGYAFT